MIEKITGFKLKNVLSAIDWKLLLFLSLFLNVKLAVKIPAIAIIYLLQFNFKFGFNLKNSRLPLFYLLVIAIAVIDLILNKNYNNPHYILAFLTGIGFWLLCLLAVHQVKLSVENNAVEVLQRTILVFFIINAGISFINIAQIVWETGAINPYRYQGEYQKYFIGTGDYIKGLTFDTSTTNAVLNAFGVIYFLTRKKMGMVLVCMVILLLTGSNFVNLALMLTVGALFAFMSNRDQKSVIVVCLMFLVVFMEKVSPQNNRYMGETFKNAIHPQVPPFAPVIAAMPTDSIITPEQARQKIAKQYLDSVFVANNKPVNKPANPPAALIAKTANGRVIVPGPDINTPLYQTPVDTTIEQRHLLSFISRNKSNLPISGKDSFKAGLPGKAVAMLQTFKFLEHHPVKLITGDGMGNFSSKLAFKATGLGFDGGYPARFAYISNEFLLNHLDVYLNFFSKKAELHSLTNSPYSVYDQLLGEYGILGLLAFAIFYFGYFIRHYKKLTYGLPLILLMLAVFFTDYWFEQLSVIVFFELLLMLNIKETVDPKPLQYEYQ